MSECRTLAGNSGAYAISIGVTWYFGVLILLGVIMLTIHKFVLNALGKRTMLFTILHIGILVVLIAILAAGQGALGIYYSSGFPGSASYHLGVAYHALFLLVTLYLTAIFAFWTRKLRASTVSIPSPNPYPMNQPKLMVINRR